MRNADQIPISPQWSSVWLRFERAHWSQSQSSIRNRRHSVFTLARWLALPDNAIMDPADVTKQHLREYMSLREATARGSGILTTYADLRVFWRWYSGEYGGCDQCADVGSGRYRFHGCDGNLMHSVSRPSPKKHRSKIVPIPTGDDLAAVLAALSGKSFLQLRDRALVLLLVESGIRRAEAASLNVSDVDLSRRGGGVIHVRCGKNASDRHSVIGPDGALALTRLLDRHPLAGIPDGTPDCPLFCTTTGRRLKPQTIGLAVRRVGEAAGVDLGRNFAPHQLRHAWADNHFRAGTNETIMRSLGGWHGTIPATYGQANAKERAITAGLDFFR